MVGGSGEGTRAYHSLLKLKQFSLRLIVNLLRLNQFKVPEKLTAFMAELVSIPYSGQ